MHATASAERTAAPNKVEFSDRLIVHGDSSTTTSTMLPIPPHEVVLRPPSKRRAMFAHDIPFSSLPPPSPSLSQHLNEPTPAPSAPDALETSCTESDNDDNDADLPDLRVSVPARRLSAPAGSPGAPSPSRRDPAALTHSLSSSCFHDRRLTDAALDSPDAKLSGALERFTRLNTKLNSLPSGGAFSYMNSSEDVNSSLQADSSSSTDEEEEDDGCGRKPDNRRRIRPSARRLVRVDGSAKLSSASGLLDEDDDDLDHDEDEFGIEGAEAVDEEEAVQVRSFGRSFARVCLGDASSDMVPSRRKSASAAMSDSRPTPFHGHSSDDTLRRHAHSECARPAALGTNQGAFSSEGSTEVSAARPDFSEVIDTEHDGQGYEEETSSHGEELPHEESADGDPRGDGCIDEEDLGVLAASEATPLRRKSRLKLVLTRRLSIANVRSMRRTGSTKKEKAPTETSTVTHTTELDGGDATPVGLLCFPSRRTTARATARIRIHNGDAGRGGGAMLPGYSGKLAAAAVAAAAASISASASPSGTPISHSPGSDRRRVSKLEADVSGGAGVVTTAAVAGRQSHLVQITGGSTHGDRAGGEPLGGKVGGKMVRNVSLQRDDWIEFATANRRRRLPWFTRLMSSSGLDATSSGAPNEDAETASPRSRQGQTPSPSSTPPREKSIKKTVRFWQIWRKNS